MASLELKGVRKSFGATPVLDDVDLTLDAREFIAFLGPSGSGKSTLAADHRRARDAPTPARSGSRAGGSTGLPPGERGVAMVFQHYALYPHMSVRENMAFGLSNARVPKDEIERRIADAARGARDRAAARPQAGGRCRAASGSASRSAARWSRSPSCSCSTSRLSNLDAALRLRTRVELAQLKQRVDAAVIMVTHDQAEAMTLADRIVVMNDRKIQQVGPPMEIYSRPANIFVAQFVGSPAMTLLPAQLVEARASSRRSKLGDGTVVADQRSASGPAAMDEPQARASARSGARRRQRQERCQGEGRAGRAARRAHARSTRASPTASRSPPRTKATAV